MGATKINTTYLCCLSFQINVDSKLLGNAYVEAWHGAPKDVGARVLGVASVPLINYDGSGAVGFQMFFTLARAADDFAGVYIRLASYNDYPFESTRTMTVYTTTIELCTQANTYSDNGVSFWTQP